MANIVVDIVLLGAVAFYARRLLGRRRIAPPRIEPDRKRPERGSPAFATADRPSIGHTATIVTRPVETASPIVAPAYLLGRPIAGREVDGTAAMMDQMSGPGVCTPPDA